MVLIAIGDDGDDVGIGLQRFQSHEDVLDLSSPVGVLPLPLKEGEHAVLELFRTVP